MTDNEFVSIHGNIFYVNEEVIDRRYCSCREIGYLIVPDGRLIVIPKEQHHGQIFLEYLSKYLEQPIEEIRKIHHIFSDNGLCYLSLLEQYQLIPYFRIGLNPINQHCNSEQSMMYEMKGILHIPKQLEQITKEQILTSQSLIETNLNFQGKEKYPMYIGNTNLPHITYNSIEFLEITNQLLQEKKLQK